MQAVCVVAALFKRIDRFHNARQRDRVHILGAGAFQSPYTRVQRRPCGEHIVDQDQALTRQPRRSFVAHFERASDIARAPLCGEPALRAGAPDPRQRMGVDGNAADLERALASRSD
jgi:hypothetical protein